MVIIATQDNKNMKIFTTGRTDIESYFSLSGIRSTKKLNHTPFIVFTEKEDQVDVEIIDNIEELLSFPAKTKVMAQWKGEWSSDFFQFTVGDLSRYLATHEKAPWHII